VAVATTAALAAPETKAPAKPAAVHVKPAPVRVAPADEYFGKLKLSVLGIRNTIKDVGANLDIDQARWAQLASKAAFAEDALHDWEKKYPQDTWLAKTMFALERMYAKLDSDDGRHRAIAAMKWLVHDFPKSWYGRTGKRELAAGKVGQPAAQTAAAGPPAATAASAAVPAAAGSAAPSAVVVPAVQTSAGPAVAPADATSNAASPTQFASPVPLPSPSPGSRLP
jgi:hypothetical protein